MFIDHLLCAIFILTSILMLQTWSSSEREAVPLFIARGCAGRLAELCCFLFFGLVQAEEWIETTHSEAHYILPVCICEEREERDREGGLVLSSEGRAWVSAFQAHKKVTPYCFSPRLTISTLIFQLRSRLTLTSYYMMYLFIRVNYHIKILSFKQFVAKWDLLCPCPQQLLHWLWTSLLTGVAPEMDAPGGLDLALPESVLLWDPSDSRGNAYNALRSPVSDYYLDSFGTSKGSSCTGIRSFTSTHHLSLKCPSRRERSPLPLSLQKFWCSRQERVAVRRLSGRRKWECQTIVPQVRLRLEVCMTFLLHFHLNANHACLDGSNLAPPSPPPVPCTLFSTHKALFMPQALSSMSSPSPSSVDLHVISSEKPSQIAPFI